MRRGQYLERELSKLIEYIDTKGYFAIKNYSERTVNGIYIAGECFDYIFILPKITLCFDAKECANDRWQFTKKEVKQGNMLKKCKNAGADAFFLVYFSNSKNLIHFDVDTFIKALTENRMHLSPNEGITWDYRKVLGTVL